jgi:phosphoketolase
LTLARISHEELDQLLRGYGYTPYFVDGDDPMKMHQLMAGALDQAEPDVGHGVLRRRADARNPGLWHPALAMGALSLFLMNLICVNLAGVTTFLVQGIHPAT